jgi:hypothetical protein
VPGNVGTAKSNTNSPLKPPPFRRYISVEYHPHGEIQAEEEVELAQRRLLRFVPRNSRTGFYTRG